MTDDQSEKARQLVAQIDAENTRQGRNLAVALGKPTAATAEIEEINHDNN